MKICPSIIIGSDNVAKCERSTSKFYHAQKSLFSLYNIFTISC